MNFLAAVYVPLCECIAAILADQTVVERLGQPVRDEICNHQSGQLAIQELTAAICSTIEVLGQRLSQCMPRAADDVNELDDSLVLLGWHGYDKVAVVVRVKETTPCATS
jgi:putative membrane protein